MACTFKAGEIDRHLAQRLHRIGMQPARRRRAPVPPPPPHPAPRRFRCWPASPTPARCGSRNALATSSMSIPAVAGQPPASQLPALLAQILRRAWSRWGAPPRSPRSAKAGSRAAAPLNRRLLASVPPLTKTTCEGCAPTAVCHLLPRLVYRLARRPPELVTAGGIAEALPQKGQHRLPEHAHRAAWWHCGQSTT